MRKFILFTLIFVLLYAQSVKAVQKFDTDAESRVSCTNLPDEWKDVKYANLLQAIQVEDYERAFIEATILASMNDVQGQYILASMYCYGAGTARNYEAAQEQLAAAASQGSNRAEYMMGGFGSIQKSHEFMMALIGTVDDSTDTAFWNQMMSSDSLPQTYKEAFKWFFLKDGEWGYRDIMYYCGVALITGAYGYKNEEHGLQWIVRSAQLGYSEAIQLINRLMEQKDEL